MKPENLHGVLSRELRPTPPNALSASWTLAWRAMLKIKHVPFQLFDVTVFPIMMTVMFTYLFGVRWPGPPRPTCSTCCRASWCRPSSS